jgi:hypothetical protein
MQLLLLRLWLPMSWDTEAEGAGHCRQAHLLIAAQLLQSWLRIAL